jgi:hypothetical protein
MKTIIKIKGRCWTCRYQGYTGETEPCKSCNYEFDKWEKEKETETEVRHELNRRFKKAY